MRTFLKRSAASMKLEPSLLLFTFLVISNYWLILLVAAQDSDSSSSSSVRDKVSAADYLATNPQIRQCCACGRANYRINFEATWDQKTDINGKTPFDYISPKWQSLIGASHDEIFSLWRYDEVAPEHMKQDVSLNAGKIQPQKTQDFLKENFRSVRTVIRMPDIPDAKGEASAQFSVDKNFHLASFLAFLSPSPDWFVGFNSVDLCDVECVWKENIRLNLYPIDAGTHSGDNFMAAREPLVQRQKIQDLRYLNRNNSNSPFYEEVRNSIPKFATVELIRTAVRDDACQSSNYNPAFGSNQGDDGVRPNQVPYEEVSPGCHMTFWTEWDWSRCREDCKRNAIRNRQFVSNVAKCATHELIQFGSCSGAVKGCPKNTESPNKY